MARDFTDVLNAVWAANALTAIPNPPIPGQAYRNTAITDGDLSNGQQYSEVYDSARYNQLLYLLSGCVKMLMETGIPEWSAEQNYQQNAYTIGSDGKLYGPAKKASGPDNSGAVDPVADAAGEATTWTLSLPDFAAPLAFDAAEGKVKLSVGNTTTVTADKLEVKIDPNGGLQGTTNGIAIKPVASGPVTVDANGINVSTFTGPTASAPGKAGLVPGPESTPLQVQPLRVMGPNAAFNTLRQGSFDVSWDEANSKKIVLGAKYVQAGTSVDAIPYAGDFYCDAWNVPGISEALTGVLIRRDPGTYGIEEEGVRSSFEILYDLSFDAIRFRKTTGSFAAGGTYTWSDWDTVTGGRLDAPCPQAAEGVGQWIGISVLSSSYTLPPGGVWAYSLTGFVAGQGIVTEQRTSVSAGGTVITATEPQTTVWGGFIWRIA
nr:MAG TPA: fiber protein [Caudoviricetes sp.]